MPLDRLRLPCRDRQVLATGQELQYGLSLTRNESRCGIVQLHLEALTIGGALSQSLLDNGSDGWHLGRKHNVHLTGAQRMGHGRRSVQDDVGRSR